MEELHRWRLFDRTGAGLMAELGSHQLDAVSIFLSSLRNDGKKVHPLSVHAVGGRHIMPLDRDADDHVYCMFEFPGPEYSETFDVGYYDPIENYPASVKNSSETVGTDRPLPVTKPIRTRRSSSPTRRSTATDSAAGAKSCWEAREH